jgi:predicted lipid-binding transport protein (Tim44 family)
MKFWALFFAGMLALGMLDAHAGKRLGSGKSLGRQSENVAQPEPTPGLSVGNARSGQTGPVAVGATGRRPWGAILAGAAAGLGLLWLANSLGMGEVFASFLLMSLVLLGAGAVLASLLKRWRALPERHMATPFAFGAAGRVPLSDLKGYQPENVGNDASARPWERSNAMPLEPMSGQGAPGLAQPGKRRWDIPPGFDVDGFLRAAKNNFVMLQAAWDRSDIAVLRATMTDGMLAEIQGQLTEREGQSTGSGTATEVVVLEALLLGIEQLPGEYMASVEFSGLIREERSAGPSPFREVWNMTKPDNGSTGWLVAGVQALQ